MGLKCKIIKDFDFIINHQMMNHIYRPIVSKQAVEIYNGIISFFDLQQQMGTGLNQYFQDLLDYLEIDENTFFNQIKKLEAMQLIEKYIEQYKQQEIIIKINPCLTWKQFCNEQKYFKLLQNVLSPMDLEKTKLLFKTEPIINFINTSSSFEEVFKDQINHEAYLDYDLFYDYLFKSTKQLVELSEQNKIILNNAYLKYNFSYKELINCIQKSLIQLNKHEYVVDDYLLTAGIKQKVDETNIKNFNLNLKINRDKHIFFKNQSLDVFKYVIADYKTLNSEHYLACIQKHYLDQKQIDLINNLRNQYHLNDYIINILIDYCIYKNNGRLEEKYLEKIALTINRLNLQSIDDLLNHLRNATNKTYEKIDYNNEIEW